jgi:hypothetical protein
MAKRRTSQQSTPVPSITIEDQQWYTAEQAAKKLSENSHRPVGPVYPYRLYMMGKVRTLQISPRVRLYSKTDIDRYIVEPRGAKSGQASAQRAKQKKEEGEAKPEKHAA